MERRSHLLCLTLLGLVLGGCDLLTGPRRGLFVYHLDGRRLERVNLAAGLAETALAFPEPAEWTLAVHGSALFAVTRSDAHGAFRLHEVDLCRPHIRWTLELGTEEEPRVMDGIALGDPGRVSVSPDGETLYLRGTERDGEAGVTALDRATREPVAFIGTGALSRVLSFRELPPGPAYPDGAFHVLAMSPDRSATVLYFLHRSTFEVMDSVLGADLDVPIIWRTELSADGRSLYGAGFSDLFRYDLVERAVVARHTAAEWQPGDVAETADGDLVAISGWNTDSGRVHVLGPDLEPVAEVDISSPVGGDPDSRPTAARELTLDRRGTTAYVTAGPTRWVQHDPYRIFAVDLAALEVTAVMHVADAFEGGVGRVVPLPDCR